MGNASVTKTPSMTPADVQEVIDCVLGGSTLKQAVADKGLTVGKFFYAISSVRELATLYARAMEIRADLWNEQIIEIANDPTIDYNRARVMIDTLKWTASKAAPRKYGERIDVNVQQTVSINDALSEARARILRPVADQYADVIDMTPGRAADVISVPTLPAPNEPDIFS